MPRNGLRLGVRMKAVSNTNFLGMNFVQILPGSFMMGSPANEVGREPDETQHEVSITSSYLLQDAPVTNRQYRAKVPTHNSGQYRGHSLNGDDQPVAMVSVREINQYIDWLNEVDKVLRYRLPTEAEWEFAARAGSQSTYPWGNDSSLASKFGNVHDLTAQAAFSDWPTDGFLVDDGYAVSSPVRAFSPNAWNLYDMIGNVWEVCGNWRYKYPTNPDIDPQGPPEGRHKVVRGSDWRGTPIFSRVANRAFTAPDDRVDTIGFRLVAVSRVDG